MNSTKVLNSWRGVWPVAVLHSQDSQDPRSGCMHELVLRLECGRLVLAMANESLEQNVLSKIGSI